MRWASTVSEAPNLVAAIDEAAGRVQAELAGAAPDLVVVFASEHHGESYDRVPELVRRWFPAGVLLGCSAGGVIGGGHEVERRPGVSLTAARLPDVGIHPFHLESPVVPPLALPEDAGIPSFLLLSDPFTFEADRFLAALDEAFPASAKVGGLASGGRQPGGNALYLGEASHRTGLVGAALVGNIEVDTIVAQGCRPIGEPMFVTRCQGTMLFELDGLPAVDVVRTLFAQASPDDRELFRHSLFLGIVMDEGRHDYRHGDFLIRNLVGIDPERGALEIGALLREQLVVQFHLRDAKTSAEDLEVLLARYAITTSGVRPEGSLLFSCLGRGQHLYGAPDHDTAALHHHLGDVPLGGFFCNGEIGPVRGRTFLHGYTSAFGLFRARTAA